MKIIKKKSKNIILKVLANSSILKILNHTIDMPTSVQEIINNTGLPYSTVYKKIKWMMKNDLLFLHKMEISKKGKKFSLFESKISRIVVIYEKGEITMSIQEK